MQLIVTRPLAQAGPWVRALRELGLQASALPLIAIEPLADLRAVQSAWRDLHQTALVIFVSANAVQHFFAARADRAGGEHAAAWPTGVLAGATGPGTAAALEAAGVAESLIVQPAADAPSLDSEALWAQLAARDWRGRRVLVVRGEAGRDWLADTLRACGAQAEFVAAYRRRAPQWTGDEQALLARARAQPQAYLWLFSSSEAVAHLGALVPGADWARSHAYATHSRIAQAARALGFGQVRVVASLPEAVARQLSQATEPGAHLQSAPP
jgi:uroporphyrinogen-III synthase